MVLNDTDTCKAIKRVAIKRYQRGATKEQLREWVKHLLNVWKGDSDMIAFIYYVLVFVNNFRQPGER